MTHEDDNDFYKLTFSQREDKVPLPEPMRLEYIPQKFRQDIWFCIDMEIGASSHGDFDDFEGVYLYGPRFITEDNLGRILSLYSFHILGQFHDDTRLKGPEECGRFFKEFIRLRDYHEVLTLIEFVLRNEYCSEALRKSLIGAFDQTPIAYFVDDKDGLPTIMPRASREAGEATQQAIETLRKNSMDGAATHLRQAAERINTRQYADSIRESISAVESVARRIAPKGNTLGEALKSLEKRGLLKNNRLKKGFEQIYAYTNSEEGVRHSLVLKEAPEVGLDEAMFMFGACASFAAYLTNKYRQSETERYETE